MGGNENVEEMEQEDFSENEEDNFAPMKIIGDIRTTGLGLCAWWNN